MISVLIPLAFSSRSALSAPAWMDFQNSWVVPLGMTAMVLVPAAAAPDPEDADDCVVAAVPAVGVEELLSQPERAAPIEQITSSAKCFIGVLGSDELKRKVRRSAGKFQF